jgi:hypothetical protein
MTIKLLTDLPYGGKTIPAGATVSLDSSAEGGLVASGMAEWSTGLAAWTPDSPRDSQFDSLSETGAAEIYGVSYKATPAFNVARMNIALATNRVVTLRKPGQYLIGGPGQGGLLIPPNTQLIVGQGVELILADQTFTPLIRNANAFDAGIPAVGSIVYGGSGGSFTGTVTAAGAANIHLKHPVGSWIGVLGLDLAQGNNRTYQGVYEVISVNPGANSITYEMVDVPPSGGSSTSGAIIYPADTGVRIFGGMWDGNWANNSVGSPVTKGDPQQWIIGLRNTWDSVVSDVKFRKGASWCAGANNVRDGTWRNLSGDLFDLLSEATVMFQGTGGCRNVLVENLSGTCEDNMAAWSLDASGVYTNHWNGDVYDLRFKNIASQANKASILNLWGNTNARFHSVDIDGVYGRSNSNGVAIDNGWAPSSMLNTRGGKLSIKNVNVSVNGLCVELRTDGDWDHIEVDGVQQRRPANLANPLVRATKRPGGTVQTIRRLDISNLNHYQPGSTINRTSPMVQIDDSNVEELTVEGIPVTRLNADTGLVNFTGVEGVVGKAVISGVRGVANSTGDRCLIRIANTNASALGQLVLRDSVMTGFDATGGLVHQTVTGKATLLRLDNTPAPALRRGSTTVPGVLRDGSGMAIDVVQATNTVAGTG